MFFYISCQIPSWRLHLPSSAQYLLLFLGKINGKLALVTPPIHESCNVANAGLSNRGGGQNNGEKISDKEREFIYYFSAPF